MTISWNTRVEMVNKYANLVCVLDGGKRVLDLKPIMCAYWRAMMIYDPTMDKSEDAAWVASLCYAILAGGTDDPDPMAGDRHGDIVVFPGEWEFSSDTTSLPYGEVRKAMEAIGLQVKLSRRFTSTVKFPLLCDIGGELVINVQDAADVYDGPEPEEWLWVTTVMMP